MKDKIEKQLKLSLESVRKEQASLSKKRKRILVRMVQEGILPSLKLHTMWSAAQIKQELAGYRHANNLTVEEVGDIVSWFITGEA